MPQVNTGSHRGISSIVVLALINPWWRIVVGRSHTLFKEIKIRRQQTGCENIISLGQFVDIFDSICTYRIMPFSEHFRRFEMLAAVSSSIRTAFEVSCKTHNPYLSSLQNISRIIGSEI